jgi:sodium pump decarboxylase gamma subunit
MSDWVAEGVTALVSGMSTVFLILILIALMISGFKHINKLVDQAKALFSKKDSRPEDLANPEIQEPDPAPLDAGIDTEEVAVITAAIAASLKTSQDALRVKKLRRMKRSPRNYR